MIIDAHTHLWKKQEGRVDGKPVVPLENGKSDFGGEIRQMMPPYMLNCENNAEMLISNMDYACVNGAVITQEEIDGNQDNYLLCVKEKYPNRIKICSLYEEGKPFRTDGFDGIKICAGRLPTQDLTKHFHVFETAAEKNLFLSIDMAEGGQQKSSMPYSNQQDPDLNIIIGAFGNGKTKRWEEQVQLARGSKV